MFSGPVKKPIKIVFKSRGVEGGVQTVQGGRGTWGDRLKPTRGISLGWVVLASLEPRRKGMRVARDLHEWADRKVRASMPVGLHCKELLV